MRYLRFSFGLGDVFRPKSRTTSRQLFPQATDNRSMHPQKIYHYVMAGLLALLSSGHSLLAYPRDLDLIVGISWEGGSLDPQNILALDELRRHYPELRVIHFINPAYFTSGAYAPDDAASRLHSVIRPTDLLGFHLSPWRSTVQSAGVLFKASPTFWGDAHSACGRDCGRDVPVTLYTTDELNAVIARGKQVLQDHGFTLSPISFVAGWLGAPHVLEALAQNGFQEDFSAIDYTLVQPTLERFPLGTWIHDLSKDAAGDSPITAHPYRGGMLRRWKMTSILDYQDTADIQQRFKKMLEGGTSGSYFYLGMHQETINTYAGRLRKALDAIFAEASQADVHLTFPTLPPPSSHHMYELMPGVQPVVQQDRIHTTQAMFPALHSKGGDAH